LVVGDANAQELGALREHVDVAVVARPGASWQNIGKDVQAFVSKGLPGTWKHSFHMVLTVLGSNEVPKVRARQQTWEKALECIKATLAGLHECLMAGQPASNIFLSSPFNLEPQATVSLYNPSCMESSLPCLDLA